MITPCAIVAAPITAVLRTNQNREEATGTCVPIRHATAIPWMDSYEPSTFRLPEVRPKFCKALSLGFRPQAGL